MKKNTHYLAISIEQPCTASWADMRPEKTGRHCFQCDKIVRDFTTATDTELADFFRSQPANICGRFRPDQVQRPLPFTPRAERSRLAPWRSAAMIGGLILSGGTVAAQTIPPVTPPVVPVPGWDVVGEVQLHTERSIRGQILNEEGEPLIGAHIVLVGTAYSTVTDFDGEFALAIPDTLEHFAIDVSYIGYIGQTQTFDRKYIAEEDQVVMQLEPEVYDLPVVVVTAENREYWLGGATGLLYCNKEWPKPEPDEVIDLILETYPNPFVSNLNVRFQAPQSGQYHLRLLDLSGKLLEQYAVHFDEGTQQLALAFELQSLPAATYGFQLQTPDGKAWTKLVTKAGR